MSENKTITKKDVLVRLRRIEGQVKGIEKMVDGEACCKDILIQVAAIRAAMNKVGSMIFENYAKGCFNCKDGNLVKPESVDDLISTLNMFIK